MSLEHIGCMVDHHVGCIDDGQGRTPKYCTENMYLKQNTDLLAIANGKYRVATYIVDL